MMLFILFNFIFLLSLPLPCSSIFIFKNFLFSSSKSFLIFLNSFFTLLFYSFSCYYSLFLFLLLGLDLFTIFFHVSLHAASYLLKSYLLSSTLFLLLTCSLNLSYLLFSFSLPLIFYLLLLNYSLC